MIATDDCYDDGEGYEPDWEDLAWQLAKDREFEERISCVRECEHQCRASAKPDGQLRNMSKERKALARELWEEYQFDVVENCFEVSENSEHYMTFPRSGVPRTSTRKDKRRIKSNLRTHLRKQFGILTKGGCSPRQVRGYEDMSFATVVAAV